MNWDLRCSVALYAFLSLSMLLFWFGFSTAYGQPYGYSFKEYEGSDTDVSYYLAEYIADNANRAVFRSVPLALTLGLGDSLGSFLIWFLTFTGTTVALLMISQNFLRRRMTFQESAFVLLSCFGILFYMITIGFYSQMMLLLFCLMFLAIPQPITKDNILLHGLLAFLMVFSHPWGYGVVFALLIVKWLAKYCMSSVFVVAFSGGAFLYLAITQSFRSSVFFGTLAYLFFIVPKTMLFLGLGDGLAKWNGMQGAWTYWMIILSMAFAFIDYNARTLFLAFFLLIPFGVVTFSSLHLANKKPLLVCLLIEVAGSVIWTLQYYASHFMF